MIFGVGQCCEEAGADELKCLLLSLSTSPYGSYADSSEIIPYQSLFLVVGLNRSRHQMEWPQCIVAEVRMRRGCLM